MWWQRWHKLQELPDSNYSCTRPHLMWLMEQSTPGQVAALNMDRTHIAMWERRSVASREEIISEGGRIKKKVYTGVQSRNKALKRMWFHWKTEEQFHWPKQSKTEKIWSPGAELRTGSRPSVSILAIKLNQGSGCSDSKWCNHELPKFSLKNWILAAPRHTSQEILSKSCWTNKIKIQKQ